ncbi:hypothetical protein [Kordiimonas gwangyangensis]|uniref:hypothetical protein n=1 Tax=Kordiimonas gwangyangensis TaxID=288022 RepID=UPI000366B390|nr:hypothetical protein [Kordiimonas gwangyangensis]
MAEVRENQAGQADEEPIVIEASWAPKDPRDRLYDSEATKGERTMSMIRIIAAFHPVLNFFLLINDAIRRLPGFIQLLMLVAVAGAVGAYFLL